MNASSPDPRYFKDGTGLRPTWRFAVRWPRRYLWFAAVRYLPFKSVQRWFGWCR